MKVVVPLGGGKKTSCVPRYEEAGYEASKTALWSRVSFAEKGKSCAKPLN